MSEFTKAPVAHLRSISHPDWLELCRPEDPGAFPVYSAPVTALCVAEIVSDVDDGAVLNEVLWSMHPDDMPPGTKLYTSPPVAAYHAWCGDIDTEAALRRAASVMQDVLTDIAGWEDGALAEAVTESRRDILALADSIATQPTPAQGRDAARYRLLRQGLHWSIVDGFGTHLRTDELDADLDAVLAIKEQS